MKRLKCFYLSTKTFDLLYYFSLRSDRNSRHHDFSTEKKMMNVRIVYKNQSNAFENQDY